MKPVENKLNPLKIITAATENRGKIIQSLILGFATDPFVRWLWPDTDSYLSTGPAFDAFGGLSLESGTTYTTENHEAVALWMPPGVETDEERMISVLEETVPEERLEDVLAVFEAMDSYYPEEPCWYLPFIAVDPFYQGQGLGSQLMKHALTRIDEDELPAYLESSNPRNISLYERYGFETMGEIQIGTSPVVTPMIRR